MKPPGKWIEGISAQSAAADALNRILKVRIGQVQTIIRGLGQDEECGAKPVRKLRVAARRADAALRLFGPWIKQGSGGGPARRALRRRLRDLRRAAGVMRDCDILSQVLRDLAERTPHADVGTISTLIASAAKRRTKAESRLLGLAQRPTRLKQGRRRVVGAVESAVRSHRPEPTLRDVALASLPPAIDKVRRSAAADLTRLDNLHRMRLHLKRLRYSLEVLGPAMGFIAEIYPQLQQAQDRLGEVNDADTVLARLEIEAERSGGPGIARLRERCARVRDLRVDGFLEWWGAFDLEGLLRAIEAALPAGSAPVRIHDAARGEPAPRPARNGSLDHPPASDAPRRLAAIDVGSNSTRLVIAEAYPDGTYRVIDDEKELSRLAHGVAQTGRLDPDIMDRAVTIVARLGAIAQGYNCSAIRAIGTAALREASNGPEFVELVRARAGIDLRIISADEEARLAYLSAARAFGDMGTLSAGVVDIGGGSTEIVLSLRGVVEQVHAIPIGAVSLTERFGGPQAAAGARFAEMKRWLRDQLRRRIPRPFPRPELVVGTGGTVTTLAAIAIRRDRSAKVAAPSTVRGYQVRRSQVRRILDELRACPLQERGSIPGLGPERADIIVAGVAIIEAVMRRLGTRRLRVHDLGVREGLLLTMIREAFPHEQSRDSAAGPIRLSAARRFARACRYEEQHSERVAMLAVQIFDALAPLMPRPRTLWSEPVARELLEAGAILHDVGYIINYAGHHKHGYHLIVHSDLSSENGGFTRREVEIVANLARYHRRSTPRDGHPNLASLSAEDRALVRTLSAILRIADGLDRTHSQNIRSVRVRLDTERAVFELDAELDPATDAWGASRKAGLFKEVFGLEPAFEWQGRSVGQAEPDVPSTDAAAADRD